MRSQVHGDIVERIRCNISKEIIIVEIQTLRTNDNSIGGTRRYHRTYAGPLSTHSKGKWAVTLNSGLLRSSGIIRKSEPVPLIDSRSHNLDFSQSKEAYATRHAEPRKPLMDTRWPQSCRQE